MENFATIVYVISDEILRTFGYEEDAQAIMSNAEVMTFTILTARFFQNNQKFSRYICQRLRLFRNILSYSRLNRRIHAIPWACWHAIFRFLSLLFVQSNHSKEYAVDSFPISSCQKNRIDKRKLFSGKGYIGYSATKKKYFCGIKVHMLVTTKGEPVEVEFRPGSEADLSVFWEMELPIPDDSVVYADGAYNSFELEDILKDELITLLAKRGKRTKNRLRTSVQEKKISSRRQIVETTFSCITDLFPRNLRACTERGFLIKVFCSIIAYSVSHLLSSALN